MIPNVRLHQLYILRSQLDLLIALEEGAPADVDGPVECPHPEDKRRDLTNMGQEPHFLCLACGQDVKGQA